MTPLFRGRQPPPPPQTTPQSDRIFAWRGFAQFTNGMVSPYLAQGVGEEEGILTEADGSWDQEPRPWPDALDQIRAMAHRHGKRPYLGVRTEQGPPGNAEGAVLIIGAPRSGKTSAIIVPNVMAWQGPVLTASVKQDVLAATVAARARLGRCWHFDPSASDPVESVVKPLRGVGIRTPEVSQLRWSPLAACQDWASTLRVARSMVYGSETFRSDQRDDFWPRGAMALLAPLLFSASLDQRSMRDVASWVRRHDLVTPGDDLRHHAELGVANAQVAAEGLIGLATARELETHWSTCDGVLGVYRDDRVLASADRPNFDADAFVRSNDTIYITVGDAEQDAVAPVIIGFLNTVRDAVYRAKRGYDDPRMLWALDEVANIAPIPDLPRLISLAGGQGLTVMAAIQDLSQARERWGEEASGFLTLFHTKIVLPGLLDSDTAERLSRLAGEKDTVVETTSTSTGPPSSLGQGDTHSVSKHTERRPRLPMDAITGLDDTSAIAVQGSVAFVRFRLTPYFAWGPWSLAAIGPERQAEAMELGRLLRDSLIGFLEFSLRQAAREVSDDYTDALWPALWRAFRPGLPLTAATYATETGIDHATAKRGLDQAVESRLLTRGWSEADRHKVAASMSPSLAALADNYYYLHPDVEQRCVSLSEAAWKEWRQGEEEAWIVILNGVLLAMPETLEQFIDRVAQGRTYPAAVQHLAATYAAYLLHLIAREGRQPGVGITNVSYW